MKRILIICGIAGLGVALYLWSAPISRNEAAPLRATDAKIAASHAKATRREELLTYDVHDPVPMGNRGAEVQRLVDYRCHRDRECDFSPGLASTEAEARWLESRGFPSPREEERLLAMPMAELELLAQQGSVAAEVILGSRKISAGEIDSGLSLLHRASVKGSVFAAYEFADAYANEVRLKDITESMAYYRLAYLQGDWKSSVSLHSRFPNASSAELTLADRRATRLYGALMANKIKNRQKVSIGPRPFPDQT